MTPNATVSYMATRLEQQLVEAKAARLWLLEDVSTDQVPGVTLRSRLMWLITILTARFAQGRQLVPLS